LCTWLRKTIFKELKALKGISGFGACNFWRFFREELHQYPTKEDRKYTESGPGTKRGINLLSLGQIRCRFFWIFTPFPKFVHLLCEGVRFYYKWSPRGFSLNDAADCRHAATHRTLSLETLNLMCALTKLCSVRPMTRVRLMTTAWLVTSAWGIPAAWFRTSAWSTTHVWFIAHEWWQA
jgi:hypothetical protein